MKKNLLGIIALSLGFSANAQEKTSIYDIPEVCRDRILRDEYFLDDTSLARYSFSDNFSRETREGVQTNVFERRIWKEPRPSFADSLRLECSWTENGNISYTYEEPSPIARPQNYFGQDSYIFTTHLFTPDGKTLLEQEVIERKFSEEGLMTLTEKLRQGVYHVEQAPIVGYVPAKIASEITDTNPETGALRMEYIHKLPLKGKIHYYASSKYVRSQNGIIYRSLESMQKDLERQEIMGVVHSFGAVSCNIGSYAEGI